mmetsp:Transcript_24776/g.62299  ORF Transcript_24776/g.62299 Transcript_24776/m.62299 type:complete len:406 (-) Transcript_24776:130-1347(-)
MFIMLCMAWGLFSIACIWGSFMSCCICCGLFISCCACDAICGLLAIICCACCAMPGGMPPGSGPPGIPPVGGGMPPPKLLRRGLVMPEAPKLVCGGGVGAGAAALGGGGSFDSSADSFEQHRRSASSDSLLSLYTQKSTPSTSSGANPSARMHSVPPSHSATFLLNAGFSILIFRYFSSVGLVWMLAHILFSVAKHARFLSTSSTFRTSATARSKSAKAPADVDVSMLFAPAGAALEEAEAEPPVAGMVLVVFPKGFSWFAPLFCRIWLSKFSIKPRICWPCGVERASSAMFTILSGTPLSQRNLATSFAKWLQLCLSRLYVCTVYWGEICARNAFSSASDFWASPRSKTSHGGIGTDCPAAVTHTPPPKKYSFPKQTMPLCGIMSTCFPSNGMLIILAIPCEMS